MTAVGVSGKPGVARDPGRRGFATTWAWALRQSVTTPGAAVTTDEIEARLVAATDRLVDAVTGDPFDPARAATVGSVLVSLGFAGPEAIRETIRLVGQELPVVRTPAVEVRIAAVQAELAGGFAAATGNRAADAQEAARRALNGGEARFRAVFEGLASGLLIADGDGRVVEANERAATLLGVSATALAGRRVRDFLVPEHRGALDHAYGRFFTGDVERVEVERRLDRPGETWLAVRLSAVPALPGDPRWHLVTIEDVTAGRADRLDLEFRASHDPLTGLADRGVFVAELGELMRDRGSGRRVGLCLIDLDGFKIVNDSLGHPVGDELLIAVAARLRDAAGEENLVARLGGDEYAILLPHTTALADVERVAARVVERLAPPVHAADSRLAVAASIGVIERSVADTTIADLMRAADLTLYRAKAQQRGRWATFDPHHTEQQVARYTLSTAMPAALERDEFVVELQPLVGLADGDFRGAEALVRWRHRELGLLSPKRFVGLAEETGAILPIGRRVLQLACRQAARWNGPYVSVNVSARQLRDPGLVADVEQALVESGLSAGRLQLELAAGAVADPPSRNDAALLGLARLGVRLAVDDVAAGWANLPLLRDLPIDVLKVSGRLVRRLTGSDRSKDDVMVVASLIELAHRYGLHVVAEGIESVEQRDQLRALGCDTGQGWLFAPALAPDELLRYLPNAAAASRG